MRVHALLRVVGGWVVADVSEIMPVDVAVLQITHDRITGDPPECLIGCQMAVSLVTEALDRGTQNSLHHLANRVAVLGGLSALVILK